MTVFFTFLLLMRPECKETRKDFLDYCFSVIGATDFEEAVKFELYNFNWEDVHQTGIIDGRSFNRLTNRPIIVLGTIDDVFSLIQKDWMIVDESNLAMPNETICEIKLSDDETMLTIGTKSFQIIAKIDNRRKYAEEYGGFIICEDEYASFVGSKLRRIYLTDSFCKSNNINIISRIPDIEQILDIEAEEADPEYIHYYVDTEGNKWGTLSNISFINFETDKGILQFVVYNYHNGYYGHDVSISINHQVIYNTVV